MKIVTKAQPILYAAPCYLVQPVGDPVDEEDLDAINGSDWVIEEPACGWGEYDSIIRVPDSETGKVRWYLATTMSSPDHNKYASKTTMLDLCDFLDVPPAEWNDWVADVSEELAVTEEYNMARVAQRATLATVYLESCLLGLTHKDAVDTANDAVRRLRKLLGYAYPERGTFEF